MDPILFLVVLIGIGLVSAFLSWQTYKASQKSQGQDETLRALQTEAQNLRLQLAETLAQQSRAAGEQLDRLTAQVNERLSSVTEQMTLSQKAVGERLDNAARVVGDVQKTLGQLGQASERIFEVGKDISGLQELLRAPKLRGGLGEFFLEDLLRQILPMQSFSTQHAFRTGDKVDAVIRLGERMVPVDAKFPLENFRKLTQCANDDERKAARRRFLADVKKHIDAVATKYILPDEGTYDFALMYIPAENVYYETILRDEGGAESAALIEYALAKRVVPVSPNSFYAYLQAILLGLRGYQVEENARHILESLSRLSGDLQRFFDDFETLGKHIGNTKARYDDAERRLSRFQEKLAALSDGSAPVAALPEKSDTLL